MKKRNSIFFIFLCFTLNLQAQFIEHYSFSKDSVVAELHSSDLLLLMEIIENKKEIKPECEGCVIVPIESVIYYDGDFYIQQPEELTVGDALSIVPVLGDVLSNILGCKCAQKFKDKILYILLCEKFPGGDFCEQINEIKP